MAKLYDVKIQIAEPDGRNSAEFDEEYIVTLSTNRLLFEGTPSIGNCLTGELECELLIPNSQIPKNARIIPFVKRVDEDTWHQKSVFYIFQRKVDSITKVVRITAYDNTYRMENPMIDGNATLTGWPKDSYTVMTDISQRCNLPIYPADLTMMQSNPKYIRFPGARVIQEETPTGEEEEEAFVAEGDVAHTMREVAGSVAASYGANWNVNDDGYLQLFKLGNVPSIFDYLVDDEGNIITFGEGSEEVALLVR